MSHGARMDPIDITWLRMDRPTNLMVIIAVLILAGPVDLGRLEHTLAIRLLAYPRFRQRIEDRAGTACWCDDPHFAIAHHIKRVRLPGRGGKAELERFVSDLASQPLDQSHPLWQFHIVEHYGGGAAVVARIHHAIADGAALVSVVLALTDEGPDAPARAGHGGEPNRPASTEEYPGFPLHGLINLARDVAETGIGSSIQILQTALGMAGHPSRAVDYLRSGTGIAAELGYLLLMPDDSPTRFKGQPCGDKRLAWTDPIPLPDVKAVSAALHCSINDLLLAAVAGALHDYLKRKGDRTAGVEVRALVPVDLRPPGTEAQLGNRFGILALELPVGIEDPLARLREVHRRMDMLKQSYEPAVTLGLLSALGNGPQAVQDNLFDLLLSRASAVMTNVRGPDHRRFLAGSELRQMMFWVPQAHNIGMGVSILSFNGKVQFGLMTDTALVPDPQTVVASFKPQFEQYMYFVLMAPWEEAPAPSRLRGASRPSRQSRRRTRP